MVATTCLFVSEARRFVTPAWQPGGCSRFFVTFCGAREPIIMSVEREKQIAAEAAALLVEPGMSVGLGTGSTVAFLLPALARRGLRVRCVASSPRTEELARNLGLRVDPFEGLDGRPDRLDLTIDGADAIAPDGWLIKGGGAAHTREKILAAAADRFVIIADSHKLVAALRGPVPVELLAFGLAATLRRLEPIGLRDVPRSPDGGVIADYLGAVDNPAALAARLEATPGLVAHGLFPPALVSQVLVGRGESVERIGRKL
jgi:ribose 5-phosphate isomerase A